MSTVQPDPARRREPARRELLGDETKASFKTSEFAVYVLMVIGLLIASAIADEASDFGAQEVWKYLTFLTVGYMLARGLAKSGSRATEADER